MDKTHIDGWENVLTKLGTSSDRRTHAVPTSAPMWTEQSLDDAYTDPLIARIVDKPADEMTREWVAIHMEDEGRAKTITQDLEDLDAQAALADGLRWARLHGGSIVVMGLDDGKDPVEEVNAKGVRAVKYLTVLNRWQVEIAQRQEDPLVKGYGQPLVYRIRDEGTTTPGAADRTRDVLVHSSRVLRFDGIPTTERRKRQLGGWHDTIITRVYDAVRDYQQSWGGVAHLMTELGQAVIKLDNLASMLAGGQDDLVLQRLAYMDTARSIVNAIPLDAQHEDWERKATPITGVPEVLRELGVYLSAVTDMPATILLGISPGGLNATGESDTRHWYDWLRSQQVQRLVPPVGTLVGHLMQARSYDVKEDWSITPNPLWQPTEKERSETRKTDAEADAIHLQWNVLAPDEVASSAYSGDRYSSERHYDEERIKRLHEAEMEGEPDDAGVEFED